MRILHELVQRQEIRFLLLSLFYLILFFLQGENSLRSTKEELEVLRETERGR